jgi:hypothetical protein
MLWQRTAAPAARLLFATLLFWLLVFRLPYIFRGPIMVVGWPSLETAVMVAVARMLYGALDPSIDVPIHRIHP